MKGQKRRHSVIETIVGTIIGYFVAMITQVIVFPMFNIHTSHSVNFSIAAIFTVVSLIRGYCVRRFFNWIYIRINDEMPKNNL